MVQDTLSTILHIEIYALIGFIIFFTFFVVVSVQAFRMKKEEIAELSNLPFDDLNTEIGLKKN